MSTNKSKDTNKPKIIGCVYENKGVFLNGRGAVYDTDCLSPTILTMSGGGNKPMVIVRYNNENNTNIFADTK